MKEGRRAGSGVHYTLNQSLPTWIQAHEYWNEQQGHIQSENTQKTVEGFFFFPTKTKFLNHKSSM